jgi:hypothetical protein
MLNNLLIILSLVLIVVAGGCANLGTAFVGSALGVAGNQSFKYFHRGTVKSVFYGDGCGLFLDIGNCHSMRRKNLIIFMFMMRMRNVNAGRYVAF